MQDQIDMLQEETNRLATDFADLSTERDSLQLRIAEAKVFADELVSTILALEAQVGELQKQVADAGW
jgi:chromosome segregation ATPase